MVVRPDVLEWESSIPYHASMASVPFTPTPDPLQPTDLLDEIFTECEAHGIPLLSGVIASYCPEADPETEQFAPIRQLHETLVRDGEMSDREAATLIDNAFLSLAHSLPGEGSSVL